jgi:hypothetical protein
MSTRRTEAADLVDGHMAQRLYDLQRDPVRYQEMWARLEKQAEEINERSHPSSSFTK